MKHVELIDILNHSHPRHRIIVLGDFNIHSVEWVSDESRRFFVPVGIAAHQNSSYYGGVAEFFTALEAAPYYQLSNIVNNASNVLDLVFVNELGDTEINVDHHSVIYKDQQDTAHKPLEITFQYCRTTTSTHIDSKLIVCYKRLNYESIISSLLEIDFEQEFRLRDVDSALEFFYEKLRHLIDTNIPKITVKKYTQKPRWWTQELLRKKNRRDKLYKRSGHGGVCDSRT